jgi:hypothetical protein
VHIVLYFENKEHVLALHESAQLTEEKSDMLSSDIARVSVCVNDDTGVP